MKQSHPTPEELQRAALLLADLVSRKQAPRFIPPPTSDLNAPTVQDPRILKLIPHLRGAPLSLSDLALPLPSIPMPISPPIPPPIPSPPSPEPTHITPIQQPEIVIIDITEDEDPTPLTPPAKPPKPPSGLGRTIRNPSVTNPTPPADPDPAPQKRPRRELSRSGGLRVRSLPPGAIGARGSSRGQRIHTLDPQHRTMAELWIHCFSNNETLPSHLKHTDAMILEVMQAAFPTHAHRLTLKVVQEARRRYNHGHLSPQRHTAPPSPSRRYHYFADELHIVNAHGTSQGKVITE